MVGGLKRFVIGLDRAKPLSFRIVVFGAGFLLPEVLKTTFPSI